jgi:hypothetical protein
MAFNQTENTMVSTTVAGSVVASIKALGADIRLAWQRLAAVCKRRPRGEYEREQAGSVDRYELERRERAWNRWQSSDGSLLGS